MLTHFPTVTQSAGFQPEPLLIAHYSFLTTLCSLGYWLPARAFVSVSTMKRFVIVETLRGVSETIFVFHEVKIDVTSGGGKYSSLKA